MKVLLFLLLALVLASCGTRASLVLTTPDGVHLDADLSDFKDRDAFKVRVERDAETGRITGFAVESSNSLTSPVAAAQADALTRALGTIETLVPLAIAP